MTRSVFIVGHFLVTAILPVAAVLGGYYLAARCVQSASFPAPSVVGMPLSEVIPLLAPYRLYPYLISWVDDATLPPGTVLRQLPHADQRVRQRQVIYLTVSKEPERVTAPAFVGTLVPPEGISSEEYRVTTSAIPTASFVQHTVIAQTPAPEQPMDPAHIHLYCASSQVDYWVIPSFCGMSLSQARQEIEERGGTIQIHGALTQGEPLITDQRPHAGSLIAHNEPFQVEVLVQARSARERRSRAE